MCVCACVRVCQSRKATVTESGNSQANIRIHIYSLSKHIYMCTPSYIFHLTCLHARPALCLNLFIWAPSCYHLFSSLAIAATNKTSRERSSNDLVWSVRPAAGLGQLS